MLLLGVLQAQAAGGVAVDSDFDLLETQVLASAESSVTFSSLSSYAADYQHLQIRMMARTNRTTADIDAIKLRFNTDTGNNYSVHALLGDGSSVVSEAAANVNYIEVARAGGNNDTDRFGAGVADILDPFATKYTTVRALAGHAAASFPRVNLFSGAWRNTDAISTITLVSSVGTTLLTGSRFSLYGIRGS